MWRSVITRRPRVTRRSSGRVSPMLKRLCGPFFIAAGANHFRNPRFYRAIMPDYLPAHDALVAPSGVAEIAGGAAPPHPRTRRPGAVGLLAPPIAGLSPHLHLTV